MKRIYQARDIMQAQLVVNLLEQQFIPAKIENSHQASGLGELAGARRDPSGYVFSSREEGVVL